MAVRCGAVEKLQSEGNATGGVPRGSIQPHQQLPHGYIGFEFDEQYLRPDYCSARSANYAVRFEVCLLKEDVHELQAGCLSLDAGFHDGLGFAVCTSRNRGIVRHEEDDRSEGSDHKVC